MPSFITQNISWQQLQAEQQFKIAQNSYYQHARKILKNSHKFHTQNMLGYQLDIT